MYLMVKKSQKKRTSVKMKRSKKQQSPERKDESKKRLADKHGMWMKCVKSTTTSTAFLQLKNVPKQKQSSWPKNNPKKRGVKFGRGPMIK